MRLAFLLCLGCGRVAFEPLDDATVQGGDCWAAWRAGTPVFTNIAPIAELADPDKDGNPWLAPDGKTLYWDNGTGDTTIYVSSRVTPGAFSERAAISGLSSPNEDTGLVMAADDRIGVITSSRAGSQGFDLWEVRRDQGAFSVVGQTAFASINDDGNQVDGYLTPDGLRIYFSTSTMTGQGLRMATRMATTDPFSAPVVVPGTGTSTVEADADVSPDELVIAYTMGVPQQLYFAVRATAGASFGAPIKLSALGGAAGNEGDPAFSANGCELFWISNRGGNRDIWRADVSPL